MYRHIVHANDGSETSFRALQQALELAALCGSKLDVLFVEEFSPRSGTIAEMAEQRTMEDRQVHESRRRTVELAAPYRVPVSVHVFRGHPVSQITAFVQESSADLLVIGASEHTNLGEIVFGRRSDRIARIASRSVLIAK